MDPTAVKKRKTEPADGVTSAITPTDLRKIIEPLTKPQLLDILQHAAVHHPDVLTSVRAIADRDPSQRKLFIRGLNITTTSQSLHSLFSAYGELEEAVVIQDKDTRNSKGFGFINFKHVDGALIALKEPNKIIDGHMTHTQLASAGVSNVSDVAGRKIYVGNVPAEMKAERLLGHFLSYGEIEDGPLGYDKVTGKARGFALFVYKTSEGARAALVDPVKIVDGVQLNCKLAWDGKKPAQNGGHGAGIQPATSTAPTGDGAGAGMQTPIPVHNSNMPQYPAPGGGGAGATQYGGYSSAHPGGSQVPTVGGVDGIGYGAGLSNNPYNAVLGGGLAPSAYGAGYNGLGGVPPSAYGVLPATSVYRLPPGPGSVPLPSTGYPQGGQYGIPPSAFPGQIPQELRPAAVPRMTHGVLYPSLPPHI